MSFDLGVALWIWSDVGSRKMFDGLDFWSQREMVLVLEMFEEMEKSFRSGNGFRKSGSF
jgi:hypothetical protein